MKNFGFAILFLCVAGGLLAAETPAGWQATLQEFSESKYWIRKAERASGKVTAAALDAACEAAVQYIVNQQKPEGNFHYAINVTTGREYEDDNQVRQAGALWSIANYNREHFTERTRSAVIKGLDFFMANQQKLPDGKTRVIAYRAERRIKTGTVALFCLALTDFISGQRKYLSPAQMKPYIDVLKANLEFLQYQEMENGSWMEEFRFTNPHERGDSGKSSPYYDGESMLAYLMALRLYRANPDLEAPVGLKERVDKAIPLLVRRYIAEALLPGGNLALPKGFYQWASMAFAIYCTDYPQGETADLAARAAMALTWWQIYGNRVEAARGNCAYAVEGLVGAWKIASDRGWVAEAATIRNTIDNILGKVMVWQVGGPFEKQNDFLLFYKPRMAQALFGGVTDTAETGNVRVDNVQHQLHAMMLARKYIYHASAEK